MANENKVNQTLSTYFEWVKLSITFGDNSINILPYLNYMMIKESIFNKVIEGKLSFTDDARVFDINPLIGGEIIDMEIKSLLSGNNYTYSFVVTGFSISCLPKSQNQEAILEFSDSKYHYFLREYSTSFKKKTISEFISGFCEDYMDIKVSADKTSGKFSFSFPYQRFAHMISYLNQYAETQEGYKGFLFYSTIGGSYLYKNLSKLFDQDVVEKFYEVIPEKVEMNRNAFSVVSINDTYDIIKVLLEKGYGSTTHYFDPETKEVVEKEYGFSDYYSKEISLGNSSLLNKKYEDTNKHVYYEADKNNKQEVMVLNSIYDSSIDFSINFKGIAERTCGTICYIKFENWSDVSDLKFNPRMTGYYLIKSIGHMFTKGSYEQNINFVRNAEMTKNKDAVESTKIAKSLK